MAGRAGGAGASVRTLLAAVASAGRSNDAAWRRAMSPRMFSTSRILLGQRGVLVNGIDAKKPRRGSKAISFLADLAERGGKVASGQIVFIADNCMDKAEGGKLHQIARKCGLDGEEGVAGALSRMEQRIAQDGDKASGRGWSFPEIRHAASQDLATKLSLELPELMAQLKAKACAIQEMQQADESRDDALWLTHELSVEKSLLKDRAIAIQHRLMYFGDVDGARRVGDLVGKDGKQSRALTEEAALDVLGAEHGVSVDTKRLLFGRLAGAGFATIAHLAAALRATGGDSRLVELYLASAGPDVIARRSQNSTWRIGVECIHEEMCARGHVHAAHAISQVFSTSSDMPPSPLEGSATCKAVLGEAKWLNGPGGGCSQTIEYLKRVEAHGGRGVVAGVCSSLLEDVWASPPCPVGFEDGGAEADAAEVRSAIDKVIQEAESVFLGHISSELGAEAGEAVRRGLLVRTGRCPDADVGDADRLLEAAFASQVSRPSTRARAWGLLRAPGEYQNVRCGAGTRGAALSAVVKGYADGETAKWVLDLFGDDPGREPVLAVHRALVKGAYIEDAESIEQSSTSGVLGDDAGLEFLRLTRGTGGRQTLEELAMIKGQQLEWAVEDQAAGLAEHGRIFTSKVDCGGIIGQGHGESKAEADNVAAWIAIKMLGWVDLPVTRKAGEQHLRSLKGIQAIKWFARVSSSGKKYEWAEHCAMASVEGVPGLRYVLDVLRGGSRKVDEGVAAVADGDREAELRGRLEGFSAAGDSERAVAALEELRAKGWGSLSDTATALSAVSCPSLYQRVSLGISDQNRESFQVWRAQHKALVRCNLLSQAVQLEREIVDMRCDDWHTACSLQIGSKYALSSLASLRHRKVIKSASASLLHGGDNGLVFSIEIPADGAHGHDAIEVVGHGDSREAAQEVACRKALDELRGRRRVYDHLLTRHAILDLLRAGEGYEHRGGVWEWARWVAFGPRAW